MTEITLKDFVAQHGQKGAGILLGVTPGAVWQMLQNQRDIYIVEKDGSVEAWEKKPIGNTRLRM